MGGRRGPAAGGWRAWRSNGGCGGCLWPTASGAVGCSSRTSVTTQLPSSSPAGVARRWTGLGVSAQPRRRHKRRRRAEAEADIAGRGAGGDPSASTCWTTRLLLQGCSRRWSAPSLVSSLVRCSSCARLQGCCCRWEGPHEGSR